jgi:putative transposase
MNDAKLLLQKHTGKQTQTHGGAFITLKSNLRWCSDAFEIKCWSGEKIQVAFSLDCCDREAMSYGAGTKTLPRPIQWLSDNGPHYASDETRKFGTSLGMIVCNTPSYTKMSSGSLARTRGFASKCLSVQNYKAIRSCVRIKISIDAIP